MASDRNGNSGRVRVLLDANALMMPVQFGVDIFSETEHLIGAYEPVILEDVMCELKGISNGHGRDAAAARVALSLGERCTTEVSRHRDLPVDERLVIHAEETGSVVVTNDRKLRMTLLEHNIDVIYLRKQKKLELFRG